MTHWIAGPNELPGGGLAPEAVIRTFRNISTNPFTAGDTLKVNLTGTNAASVLTTVSFEPGSVEGNAPGNKNSAYNTVLDDTDGNDDGIYVIALDDLASGAEGECLIVGRYTQAAAAGVSAGEWLSSNGSQVLVPSAASERRLAFALEDASGGFAHVIFNGVEGFGLTP